MGLLCLAAVPAAAGAAIGGWLGAVAGRPRGSDRRGRPWLGPVGMLLGLVAGALAGAGFIALGLAGMAG